MTLHTAPVEVSKAKESHRKWRESKKLGSKRTRVGTTFTFSLNGPARVAFKFTQPGGAARSKASASLTTSGTSTSAPSSGPRSSSTATRAWRRLELGAAELHGRLLIEPDRWRSRVGGCRPHPSIAARSLRSDREMICWTFGSVSPVSSTISGPVRSAPQRRARISRSRWASVARPGRARAPDRAPGALR